MRQLIAAAAAAMVLLTGVLTAVASTIHRQELTPAQPEVNP